MQRSTSASRLPDLLAVGPVDAVPYQPQFEQPENGEAEAIGELKTVFVQMARTVAQAEGEAHRAVHAKGQALLRGELQVLGGLPHHYAQGLFATPARYETVVRFSSPPAEQLPDSVSTPRAMAVKVLGVPGARVPESADDETQDFLMVNAPAFARPGPREFVKDVRLLAATTERAPGAKKLLSAVLRTGEALVETLGGDSTRLKGLGGQPQTHPLAETYYSQVPFLYGTYMAKFSLVPVAPAMTALEGERLDASDDAQREAIRSFFAAVGTMPAEWELCVQLCTDIEKMPLEDASIEWDATVSPYVAVARLVVPPQPAWDEAAARLEQALAFDPWHALAAHRPLGGVNRARRVVMQASRDFRAGYNRCPIHEPRAARH